MPSHRDLVGEATIAVQAPVYLLHVSDHVPPVEEFVEKYLGAVAALVNLRLQELKVRAAILVTLLPVPGFRVLGHEAQVLQTFRRRHRPQVGLLLPLSLLLQLLLQIVEPLRLL